MVAETDNFVKQKSTSTGTGNFTLSDLSPARRSFNTAFGTGGTDVFQYAIFHQGNNQFEFGTGHLSDSTTLVRDTVEDSSNGDSLVDFTSGDKIVLCDIPAGKYGPALDIDNNDSNESSRLQEIATTNEPSSPIASEPTADKALFDWGNITSIAGVGNRELVDSQSVSSATSNVDLNGMDSTYNRYVAVWEGVVPGTDDSRLFARLSNDGGSTFENTEYDLYGQDRHSGGFSDNVSYNGGSDLNLESQDNPDLGGGTAGEHSSGWVVIHNPADTGLYTHVTIFTTSDRRDDNVTYWRASGRRGVTEAISAVRFSMASGDINEGEFELWGV